MNDTVVEGAHEIRRELERVVASRLFANSARLIRFLHFTVDAVLNGRAHFLKEQTIGTQVYDRPHSYDPRVDSVVRVEARRLRMKLRQYYATVGESSELKIEYPIGSYAPVFLLNGTEDREKQRQVNTKGARDLTLYGDGDGLLLVVCPFEDLSGTETGGNFSKALTDELIYQLSMSPGFRVSLRSSGHEQTEALSVKSGFENAPTAHVLMRGTVRRNEGMHRVTVELYDSTGFVVWADRLDARDDTIPNAQDQVASAIVARCRLDYTPLRSMMVSPGLTAVRSLGVVARARRHIDEQDPVAIAASLRLLGANVEKNPSDTGLLSAIADGHVELFLHGVLSHEVAYDVAKPAVSRVLALDEMSAAGNCAAAAVHGWLRWNWPRAAVHVRSAQESGDSIRSSYLSATLLSYEGRFDEAISQLNYAAGLDPFARSTLTAIARTLFLARQYDSLIEKFAGLNDASHLGVIRYLGLAYVVTGAREEAGRLIDALPPLRPSMAHRTVAAELEAWAGRPYRAARILEDKSTPSGEHALLALAIGDHSMAIAALDAARRKRDPLVLTLRFDPRFDALRRFERFNDIEKQSRVVLQVQV